MFYKDVVRPVLFALSRKDPEVAHSLMIDALAIASRSQVLLKIIEAAYAYTSSDTGHDLFGLHFPNPVGLAAGFEKDGRCLPILAALGFGFIEAGGVTCHAQPGNERPRIFRFPQDNALINAMGFPNYGADIVAYQQFKNRRPKIPIGWNIAKSKITPLEHAAEDYVGTLRKLYLFGDYFVVNVSSPNTPGLRQLEGKQLLDQLLQTVTAEIATLASAAQSSPKPVLVKISPDLTEGQIDDVIDVCLQRNIQGIIATNTTVGRKGLHSRATRPGGLSGRPLAPISLEVVRYLAKQLDGRFPIIGVGGIASPDDAKRMFDAGASLIQIYTGFIYEGPALIKRINVEVSDAWKSALENAKLSLTREEAGV